MIKDITLLPVRSDTLFHDLFCQEEMDTLEWAVMKILGCNYEDIHGKVKIQNIRLTRVSKKERNKYLDLIVEYNNEKIIIELNNNFDGIYTRNILYAANVLLNNYKIRSKNLHDNYYKQVIRVLLVNLNWYKGEKGKQIESKKEYEIPYSDFEDGYLMKIINVNLDSFQEVCYDKVRNEGKLYKLLTVTNKEDLDKITESEKLLENYKDKLIDLSSNIEYAEAIMDEIIEENILKQRAYLAGKEDGFERGIQEKEQQVVIEMYNKNLSLDLISEITKLSIKEIEKIINN